jgi:serine/threonine protein kinase/transposase
MSNVLSDDKRQQILALGRLGWSLRRIEQATGVRRETAGAYLKAAGISVRPPGWGQTAKPAIEVTTDSGPPAQLAEECTTSRQATASQSACEPYRELIESGVQRGRNAIAIWQDLVTESGFSHSYQSVKRFVNKLSPPAAPQARVVIMTEPGEEAQVDYGTGPMVRDQQGGKYRRTRLFVMTLGFSRKSVRLLVFRSSSRVWAELHEKAFRRLGGSVRIVVLDNLREGVLTPDNSYEQRITLLNLNDQMIAGRFRLLRRTARGSFAEIYVADNLSPKDDEPLTVAVKVLNLGLQGQLDALMQSTLIENLKLEADSLSRLRHPHIVRLYESGEERDERSGRQLYYLVMEYMGGGDLNSVCRMKPLLLEDAVVYLGQICSALSCAHEHGIIHRDIKPNNLLLSEDGSVVKLLDFGTAQLLENQNGIITRVGTPVYSAPESYSPADGVGLTSAADIYSLAKLLLFMMTGDSPAHLAQKQIVSIPPTLTNQPWSEWLLAVLKKATSDKANKRYQTVDEFYRELRNVLELTEVAARPAQKKAASCPSGYQPARHSRFEVPVPNRPALAYASTAGTFFGRAWLEDLMESLEQTVRFIPTKLAVRILLVLIIMALLLVVSPPILRWWRGPSLRAREWSRSE